MADRRNDAYARRKQEQEKNMQQPPDMNAMLANMAKMQEAIEKLQTELANTPVEGTSGGGAVKVTCTGGLDFTKVKINKDAVDPADVETLEDLVLTAIKDACQKAKQLGEQKMGKQLSGMQLPPGLGF
jgi:DNA-binding YbaB/EbfC family protein